MTLILVNYTQITTLDAAASTTTTTTVNNSGTRQHGDGRSGHRCFRARRRVFRTTTNGRAARVHVRRRTCLCAEQLFYTNNNNNNNKASRDGRARNTTNTI